MWRDDDSVESRLGLIWLALLGITESTDALTTAFDRARGSIESMAVTAAILDQGGLALLVTTKASTVLAVAAALLLTLRWLQRSHHHARAVFVYVLSAIRMSTVFLAIVSLNNALLLRSLG